jgi:5-deoxy-glucuronate isomerase
MPPMLADTLFRTPRLPGLHPLQKRGDHGARELTSFRLRLDRGASHDYMTPDEETICVLQEGRGTFDVDGRAWPVSRSGVFTERASAVYVPPGRHLIVHADDPLEAILVSTPATDGGTPAIVTPDDVHPVDRGRDLYAREVHSIFVTDPHARRLMVGETFNPPGHWSSFPPHKHDGRDGEPVLEEVYHYRVEPPHGFGHQMLYTADGENVTHVVRDGDAVLLPYGYHPVSAPPGYRLYYLWAMAGAERRLALHEDPAHTWIHEIQNSEF